MILMITMIRQAQVSRGRRTSNVGFREVRSIRFKYKTDSPNLRLMVGRFLQVDYDTLGFVKTAQSVSNTKRIAPTYVCDTVGFAKYVQPNLRLCYVGFREVRSTQPTTARGGGEVFTGGL